MKYKNPRVIKRDNTKNIEGKAIDYIVKYLKEQEKIKNSDIKIQKIKGKRLEGADIKILKNGKCIKWIEAKGCNKKETNIRITPQSLFKVAEDGGLPNYFIYSVYEINSKNPKLAIFNYKTFKKHKIIEIKYIIQPFKIKDEAMVYDFEFRI